MCGPVWPPPRVVPGFPKHLEDTEIPGTAQGSLLACSGAHKGYWKSNLGLHVQGLRSPCYVMALTQRHTFDILGLAQQVHDLPFSLLEPVFKGLVCHLLITSTQVGDKILQLPELRAVLSHLHQGGDGGAP